MYSLSQFVKVCHELTNTILLAGADGLEPSLRESKSRALPLRYAPIKSLAVHQTPFTTAAI